MRNLPEKGDVYSHPSGATYTVVAVANMDATRVGWTPTVVYEDALERIWSRPLTEFVNKMKRVPE